MTTTSLKNLNYKLEEYGTLCAMTKVMIDRPGVGDWNYTLMFEVYPTPTGVDGKGARASGSADCACLTNPPHAIEQNKVIEIGGTIKTFFGNYRVEWFSRTNHDHLTLVPVE